jgi:hypothetical protein
MKYRGVEYYVAQGVETGTWKLSTSMNDKIRTGCVEKPRNMQLRPLSD